MATQNAQMFQSLTREKDEALQRWVRQSEDGLILTISIADAKGEVLQRLIAVDAVLVRKLFQSQTRRVKCCNEDLTPTSGQPRADFNRRREG